MNNPVNAHGFDASRTHAEDSVCQAVDITTPHHTEVVGEEMEKILFCVAMLCIELLGMNAAKLFLGPTGASFPLEMKHFRDFPLFQN